MFNIGIDFGNSLLILLLIRSGAVPLYGVFHKGNAFAFYGLHDNGCRHSFYCFCFIECSLKLIHIISVCNIDHMEIKSFKFLVDRIR